MHGNGHSDGQTAKAVELRMRCRPAAHPPARQPRPPCFARHALPAPLAGLPSSQGSRPVAQIASHPFLQHPGSLQDSLLIMQPDWGALPAELVCLLYRSKALEGLQDR